jgi:transposase
MTWAACRRGRFQEAIMDVIYPHCAGLDVHKQTVVACARLSGDGAPKQEARTFPTTTSGLLALADWLESLGVQHVAMEATGVYWKPVWHVLEGHFVLVLANAAHVKNVPGRKTDVNDAMWLADLLAHGLIRASFVPPVAVQELRTLTQTRKQFVRERGSHAQRIEKILEDANLKLSSAISDILGKSGHAVLKAIIDGEADPQALVSHIGRVKATRAELIEALRGRITTHHRFMLKLHLDHIDTLDKAIAQIEMEVCLGLEPFRRAAKPLSTMPGLSSVSAHVVETELRRGYSGTARRKGRQQTNRTYCNRATSRLYRFLLVERAVESSRSRHSASARRQRAARVAGSGQSTLTPGSLRMPRSKVAVNSQSCRACLATTRQSANPQEPVSNRVRAAATASRSSKANAVSSNRLRTASDWACLSCSKADFSVQTASTKTTSVTSNEPGMPPCAVSSASMRLF